MLRITRPKTSVQDVTPPPLRTTTHRTTPAFHPSLIESYWFISRPFMSNYELNEMFASSRIYIQPPVVTISTLRPSSISFVTRSAAPRHRRQRSSEITLAINFNFRTRTTIPIKLTVLCQAGSGDDGSVVKISDTAPSTLQISFKSANSLTCFTFFYLHQRNFTVAK